MQLDTLPPTGYNNSNGSACANSSKYGTIGTGCEAQSDVPAVSRALDVLELLAQASAPLTLAQITQTLRLPKGSAHRLLATLRGRGYVAFSNDGGSRGGYVLGVGAALLAPASQPAPDLVQAARLPMQTLAEQTGEGCQLSVRAGGRAVCIARTASPLHPDVALMGAVAQVSRFMPSPWEKSCLRSPPMRNRPRILPKFCPLLPRAPLPTLPSFGANLTPFTRAARTPCPRQRRI